MAGQDFVTEFRELRGTIDAQLDAAVATKALTAENAKILRQRQNRCTLICLSIALGENFDAVIAAESDATRAALLAFVTASRRYQANAPLSDEDRLQLGSELGPDLGETPGDTLQRALMNYISK